MNETMLQNITEEFTQIMTNLNIAIANARNDAEKKELKENKEAVQKLIIHMNGLSVYNITKEATKRAYRKA